MILRSRCFFLDNDERHDGRRHVQLMESHCVSNVEGWPQASSQKILDVAPYVFSADTHGIVQPDGG